MISDFSRQLGPTSMSAWIAGAGADGDQWSCIYWENCVVSMSMLVESAQRHSVRKSLGETYCAHIARSRYFHCRCLFQLLISPVRFQFEPRNCLVFGGPWQDPGAHVGTRDLKPRPCRTRFSAWSPPRHTHSLRPSQRHHLGEWGGWFRATFAGLCLWKPSGDVGAWVTVMLTC